MRGVCLLSIVLLLTAPAVAEAGVKKAPTGIQVLNADRGGIGDGFPSINPYWSFDATSVPVPTAQMRLYKQKSGKIVGVANQIVRIYRDKHYLFSRRTNAKGEFSFKMTTPGGYEARYSGGRTTQKTSVVLLRQDLVAHEETVRVTTSPVDDTRTRILMEVDCRFNPNVETGRVWVDMYLARTLPGGSELLSISETTDWLTTTRGFRHAECTYVAPTADLEGATFDGSTVYLRFDDPFVAAYYEPATD